MKSVLACSLSLLLGGVVAVASEMDSTGNLEHANRVVKR